MGDGGRGWATYRYHRGVRVKVRHLWGRDWGHRLLGVLNLNLNCSLYRLAIRNVMRWQQGQKHGKRQHSSAESIGEKGTGRGRERERKQTREHLRLNLYPKSLAWMFWQWRSWDIVTAKRIRKHSHTSCMQDERPNFVKHKCYYYTNGKSEGKTRTRNVFKINEKHRLARKKGSKHKVLEERHMVRA